MASPTTAATRSPIDTRDRFLRWALRADAILTGVMGVAGLAVAPWIAEISGTTTAFEYSMAAFFVGYGIVVYGLSTMKRVATPGLLIMVGNIVFTVAAVALVLSGVFDLTGTGVTLTLASGVFTLVMADLQYLGLRRLRS